MAKDNYEFGSASKPPVRGAHAHRHGGLVEKPKDFKGSMGKLIKYSKKFIPIVVVSILLAVLGTALSLAVPQQISKITDVIEVGLVGAIDFSLLKNLALILLMVLAFSFIFSYSQAFIMASVTQNVEKNLRRDMSEKINRLPLKYYDNTTYGDVLSRITNDVDTLGRTMQQSLPQLISGVILLVGSTVLMFTTNWILALVGIFSSIIGFFFVVLIMKKSQKYFRAQQRELGKINGQIEEVFAGHQTVKLYNGENNEKKKFQETNEKLREVGQKAQFISSLMQPIMAFVGNLGYVAVCVVGGALAFSGVIKFSVIVAFMMYVRMFSQPLSTLAQAFNQLQSTAAASERVFEFLEESEMSVEYDGVTLKNIKGNIDFENVKFSYVEGKPIVKGFSANIKAGQKIAIVGPTGAGKTTLVNLLMRFYEVDSGDIKIDGVPVSNLTRSNIHDLFGMVLQDTWLFEGTILDNIVYSKKGVSLETVKSVCKEIGIHHFIKNLKDGYNTVLNAESSLSQGQKQLITIARAMIENAPMIILDEATSSIDTRTEQQIQRAMDKVTKGRTSFIIAHRLSTIKNADVIFVMKGGDILENGSHQELMAKGGFYYELYNSQFTN